MCYFGMSQCPALSVIKSAFTHQYLYVSPPVFFRSRSGRPRRPWPSSTKHRTSSSDQACWLAPCSVPTSWLKEDFRYRSLMKFLSHHSQQKLPGELSQASWHLYIGFCSKRRWYYVENSSLQLHQPNAVQSVWCVSVIGMWRITAQFIWLKKKNPLF